MPIGWLKWGKLRIVVALVIGFGVGSCGASKSEAQSKAYYRALYRSPAPIAVKARIVEQH